MRLFIDLETSGLLVKGKSLGHEDQPWPVSIAAMLAGDDLVPVDFVSLRIRADGRTIAAGAEAVHGVSSRQAARAGISEIAALGVLCGLAAQARYLIGYSLAFDRAVIESALIRLGKSTRIWTRPGLEAVDLIEPAAQVCKIESGHESGSYRWPSLDEACEIILGEPRRQGVHSAWDDMQRAARLWQALADRGVIEREAA